MRKEGSKQSTKNSAFVESQASESSYSAFVQMEAIPRCCANPSGSALHPYAAFVAVKETQNLGYLLAIATSFRNPNVTAARLTPSLRASAAFVGYTPSSSIRCHFCQRSSPRGSAVFLTRRRFWAFRRARLASGTTTPTAQVRPTVSSGEPA